MSVLRVNVNELTWDEWGADVCYLNGEPFTGIAYEHYENGQLRSEAEREDGQLRGFFRSWYPSGAPKIEIYIAKMSERERGIWRCEWYENGLLKHERSSDKLGFCITEKKWNENGDLIYEYERPASDGQAQG